MVLNNSKRKWILDMILNNFRWVKSPLAGPCLPSRTYAGCMPLLCWYAIYQIVIGDVSGTYCRFYHDCFYYHTFYYYMSAYLEELYLLCPFCWQIAAVPYRMMLAFFWLEIGVFGTGGADTLDFSSMAMSVFHNERSHYFADFALKKLSL